MPALPIVNTQLLVADVDEHALEHLVEVERLAGNVLEVPRQLAVVDVERDGRRRVERRVEDRGAAAGRHPRLGLRDAPVGEIQIGIVAAGDPRLAALAEGVGQLAPRVAAGLAGVRDRVELPGELAGVRVVGADEAAVGTVARRSPAAPGSPCRARRSDRSCSRSPWRDRRSPSPRSCCAVARVERDEPRVGRRDDHLVLVDRDVAHRAHADLLDRADLVSPRSDRRSSRRAPARCCRVARDT